MKIIDPVWLRCRGVNGHDVHILKEDIQGILDIRCDGGYLKVFLNGGTTIALSSETSEDIKNEILDHHYFKHEKAAQKEKDMEGYAT